MSFKASKKQMKSKRYHPGKRRLLRKLKASASLIIASLLIVGGIFSYVWPRLNFMTLIYDYNNLQARENELKQYNKMLKLELSSIVSYEKVERIAKGKMKMIVPEDKNIVLVKVQD